VVVVSACYSGGFIPALRDPDTLVITAARADRASFGCGAESSVTWFGRAWLVEGLNREASFIDAYEYATRRVAEWEKTQDFKASFPQMWRGKDIATTLREWRAQQPLGEAVAYPYPLDEPGAEQ
jgi:hypothetical protein